MADSQVDRVRELVIRSAPDPKRERLPTHLEEQFVDVDRNSAACYAQMENLSSRAADLARSLLGEEEPLPPCEDTWDDDSLVVHIEEVRQSAKRADSEDGSSADEK